MKKFEYEYTFSVSVVALMLFCVVGVFLIMDIAKTGEQHSQHIGGKYMIDKEYSVVMVDEIGNETEVSQDSEALADFTAKQMLSQNPTYEVYIKTQYLLVDNLR